MRSERLCALTINKYCFLTPIILLFAMTATASGSLTFQSVSAGGVHSCGLTTDGDAYCWGRNTEGQLGDGTNTDSNEPVPVSDGLTFQSLSAGGGHTCGVTMDEDSYCWGAGANGRLGNGTVTNRNVPVAVSGGLAFQSVSASQRHTCGVTTDGDAYCWGENGIGQLGDGTYINSNVPVAVLDITFESVSAGAAHTCGVTTDGDAYCWGWNDFGQLGDGTNTDSNEPVPVSDGLTFQSLSAGGGHTCGVTTDGDAYCWGLNDIGQLGGGNNTSSNIPVAVSGGLTFQSVNAGDNHSCGLTTAGAAYCWGQNTHGELGNGTTGTDSNVPVAVSGGLTFQSVSAGRFHSCGVTIEADAYCWGAGERGRLGNCTNTSSSVPVLVRICDDEGPDTRNIVATPNPVAIGSTVDLTANVDDTNTGESNVASAEYSLNGVGGPWTAMIASDDTFDEVSEDVETSFNAPIDAGIYDLCVRGTDDVDNRGEPECIMLVVYDPSGGFVTGGGWIDSPAGAYRANDTLTGKANFGFVSKYKKGATVPTGNTEFQFKAGDLNFHSSSYEFLVITMGGTNAQFKGHGLINGGLAPNGMEYRFMLWARDGSPDAFRIKIWYEGAGEEVVYDNGFDQEIGGGSIVVHTKGK